MKNCKFFLISGIIAIILSLFIISCNDDDEKDYNMLYATQERINEISINIGEKAVINYADSMKSVVSVTINNQYELEDYYVYKISMSGIGIDKINDTVYLDITTFISVDARVALLEFNEDYFKEYKK